MKKIIVAACLIFATSSAFAQPRQNDPFSNDHGQNDCQCIGIGIPTPTPDAAIKNAPGNTTPHTPKSTKGEEPGIWYTFFKFYLAELSNSLTHQKIQNEEYNTLQSARFKDELDQQKDAFHFGRMKLADETDFEKKSHEREWTMKMTEMRRDFDNKMADERDNHEKVIGQLRYDYEKRLADQGRNSTRAMDDRVRAYEHQMKEQELAFKQREQFLNERYQEELDKMKRSNARLIQTKS